MGKSSLLVRLTDQRFMTNPDPTVRPHTPKSRPCNLSIQLGVEFGSKLIEIPEQGKVIKLQCQSHLLIILLSMSSSSFFGQVGILPGPSPSARSRARIIAVLRAACSSMM